MQKMQAKADCPDEQTPPFPGFPHIWVHTENPLLKSLLPEPVYAGLWSIPPSKKTVMCDVQKQPHQFHLQGYHLSLHVRYPVLRSSPDSLCESAALHISHATEKSLEYQMDSHPIPPRCTMTFLHAKKEHQGEMPPSDALPSHIRQK